MFWNCPVTEKYKEKRRTSYNADIMDLKNDINYTNEVKRDLELIKPKKTRLIRVSALIKFDKNPQNWFCLYDSKYIRKYSGETVKKSKVIPMKRYLDELYDPDVVNNVIDRFDCRGFYYADLMSQALFQSQLKLIKNK